MTPEPTPTPRTDAVEKLHDALADEWDAYRHHGSRIGPPADMPSPWEHAREMESQASRLAAALAVAQSILWGIQPEIIEQAYKRASVKHEGDKPMQFIAETLASWRGKGVV